MGFLPDHNVPWDLISSALENGLSVDEEGRLQEWISSSAENRDLFNQLKILWNERIDDYAIYQKADEVSAWNILLSRLENRNSKLNENSGIVTGDFTRKRKSFMSWASVAAILLIAAGLSIWYTGGYRSRDDVYQTASGEQRKVSLPDGSTVRLYPGSRIEISKQFNKQNRVVKLVAGEAFFDIKHDEKSSFIVDMGTATVKDIGTSFFIQKKTDSIKVTVETGEVVFTVNENNESRKLSAGMSLQFFTETENAKPVILVDSALISKQNLLYFDKTVLSDIVLKLQQAFNKTVVIVDSSIAQKRFTANLEGQSLEGALEILSKSLNIKYFAENDVYYLKNK